MSINIIPLLKSWADLNKKREERKEEGLIISSIDSIITVINIENIQMGEILKVSGIGVKVIVISIHEESIKAVILSGEELIVPGDMVTKTNELFCFPVTSQLLGRVVNTYGTPIDDSTKLAYAYASTKINIKAPGIISRYKVNEPLQTGIKAIDSLIPIGRGQRELIIGDKSTGKSTIGIDAILNQKANAWVAGTHVHCIYVSIGQRRANVAKIAHLLKKKKIV